MNYRLAETGDLEKLAQLELASYPHDEAASLETMAYRLRHAPECFLVATDDAGTLVGFVSGTRTGDRTLRHASMTTHVADGSSLCIHSVVVEPSLRRQGRGLALVDGYCAHIRDNAPGVERILLIAKQHMIEFYRRAGFVLVGPSAVVHGRDPWFEFARSPA